MERNAVIVILNEVKNLMISTQSIIEILRLSPQNDITTQPLKREERSPSFSICSRAFFYKPFDNIFRIFLRVYPDVT
jgi:hypothetical protein